ncbi:MAG: DUF2027 domain-containing protein [Sphingobacteriales bacterium JAD_PAG50586_3]|nr:MAG: DUF2027 domain-containing protein [Sphingobacteriales bacterium JAD_PAG50586_3]
MELRIGDKVSFLNERGTGKITRFMPNNMALVETQDGFEMPYPVKELVPENYAAVKTISVAPVAMPANSAEQAVQLADGIYLCFLPTTLKDLSASRFSVAIYNNTRLDILFNLFGKNVNGHSIIGSDRLLAGRSVVIDTVPMGDLDKYSGGVFQCLFYSGKADEIKDPESLAFKVKTVKLVDKANYNLLAHFNAPAVAITVYPRSANAPKTDTDYSLQDLAANFGKEQPARAKKPQPQVYEMEVDLHIEELLDNMQGLTNGEMLEIQLTHARKKLEEAVIRRCRKVVFIHGVGNGRLKTEIRNLLTNYTGLEFFDASLAKYGHGATEVRLGNVRLA